MTLLSAALTLTTILAATPYGDARQASLADGRPLVVLVGADWCPHCVTMKKQVIPQLEADGTLAQVAFAQVDATRQQELARKLMSGTGIPQLVMYRKTDAGWVRSQLRGAQSASAVRAFLRSATVAESPRRERGEAVTQTGG